jgi:cytochrome bd-type quinol oxidase subunit 2
MSMPTTQIIIPLIVAGITLGSLLVSQTRSISKKKLVIASLVSGLLNAANAFLVYTFLPPPTFTRTGTGGGPAFRAAGGANSENAFLVSAFITGFLIVLAIVLVALAYARFRGGKSEEETETDQSEESKLEET